MAHSARGGKERDNGGRKGGKALHVQIGMTLSRRRSVFFLRQFSLLAFLGCTKMHPRLKQRARDSLPRRSRSNHSSANCTYCDLTIYRLRLRESRARGTILLVQLCTELRRARRFAGFAYETFFYTQSKGPYGYEWLSCRVGETQIYSPLHCTFTIKSNVSPNPDDVSLPLLRYETPPESELWRF